MLGKEMGVAKNWHVQLAGTRVHTHIQGQDNRPTSPGGGRRLLWRPTCIGSHGCGSIMAEQRVSPSPIHRGWTIAVRGGTWSCYLSLSFGPLYLGCWEKSYIYSETEPQSTLSPSGTVVPIFAAPTLFWTLASRNWSWLRWLSRKHWFGKTNGLRSHITFSHFHMFIYIFYIRFYVNVDMLPCFSVTTGLTFSLHQIRHQGTDGGLVLSLHGSSSAWCRRRWFPMSFPWRHAIVRSNLDHPWDHKVHILDHNFIISHRWIIQIFLCPQMDMAQNYWYSK